MTRLCLVLLSVIILVSSNPLGQLVQPCSVCQPTTYTNPAPIPVVIQQPSNNNPYQQSSTAQTSTGFPGPFGDTLNQIIMERLLSNPSFQKIIDPSTKLYNQNGDQVQRQAPNTAAPNVINNYFIVPSEFFNINNTTNNDAEEIANVNQKDRKPHRRKTKKRTRIIEPSTIEDDYVTVVNKGKRPKQDIDEVKRNQSFMNVNHSIAKVDEPDEAQEAIREKGSKRKQRLYKKNKIKQSTSPPSLDELNEDDSQELDNYTSVNEQIKEKDRTRLKPKQIKSNNEDIIEESLETTSITQTIAEDNSSSNKIKDNQKKDLEEVSEISKVNKPKRVRRKKKKTESEDNTLKNIQIPADIYERNSENRKVRNLKRNDSQAQQREKIAPIPEYMSNNFFPYMPSGNIYNPSSMYPYNFDQYYQYLDPVRNFNANSNRNKRKRKNKNRKSNDESSNTHTIEITLIPSNERRTTDSPVTSEAEYVKENKDPRETERLRESVESVTEIPMQIPQKVSPKAKYEEEFCSKESYETFSKLEDLYEYVTPELGREDIVPTMHGNRIINDYYPVFDDDVYYGPYAENVKSLEDDRYFYETGNHEFTRERRKNDKYEDYRNSLTKTKEFVNIQKEKPYSKLENIENVEFTEDTGKDFVNPDVNKFDHSEYLDHISSFSDKGSSENQTPSPEIRRIQIPSKNTRAKTDNIETVFAGSKVAKYGMPLRGTINDSAYIPTSDESSYVDNDHTSYVFAKSLGRYEDYY